MTTSVRQVRALRCLAPAWVLLVMALLAAPVPAPAQTLAERFQGGVAAFQAGRFDDAAAAFSELVVRFGVQAPEAWLNLGAAQFEAGRPGPAILALHRTIRLAPDGSLAETARVNLARIRAALNEREGQAGTGFVFGAHADAWTALLGWVDARVALALFLGCWTLFFVALGVWRLGVLPGRGRVLAWVVAALGLALAVTGTAAYGSHRVDTYQIGVVMTDQAALRDDVASTRATLRLPEGLELRVVALRGAWAQVRLSSGSGGWMSRDDIGVP